MTVMFRLPCVDSDSARRMAEWFWDVRKVVAFRRERYVFAPASAVETVREAVKMAEKNGLTNKGEIPCAHVDLADYGAPVKVTDPVVLTTGHSAYLFEVPGEVVRAHNRMREVADLFGVPHDIAGVDEMVTAPANADEMHQAVAADLDEAASRVRHRVDLDRIADALGLKAGLGVDRIVKNARDVMAYWDREVTKAATAERELGEARENATATARLVQENDELVAEVERLRTELNAALIELRTATARRRELADQYDVLDRLAAELRLERDQAVVGVVFETTARSVGDDIVRLAALSSRLAALSSRAATSPQDVTGAAARIADFLATRAGQHDGQAPELGCVDGKRLLVADVVAVLVALSTPGASVEDTTPAPVPYDEQEQSETRPDGGRPYIVLPADQPALEDVLTEENAAKDWATARRDQAALPARFHTPRWFEHAHGDGYVCAVCWGDGWTSGWPCVTARKGDVFGEAVSSSEPVDPVSWRALLDTADRLLDELFRQYVTGPKGHPGEPCTRTHWVRDATVQRWGDEITDWRAAIAAERGESG